MANPRLSLFFIFLLTTQIFWANTALAPDTT
jgi:hypothetical protein